MTGSASRVAALAMSMLVAGLAAQVSAAPVPAPRTLTVTFPRGAKVRTLNGRIQGYGSTTYRIEARAGQILGVSLRSSNLSANFNLFAEGSDTAIFSSATSGPAFRGVLSDTGVYKVDVFLMRSAARRNEVAPYSVTIRLFDSRTAGAVDVKVPGTTYNATATIACAVGENAPMGQCQAGVMRYPGGEATVEIMLPGGGKRHIYFDNGRATSSDSRVTGFDARKTGDLNRIGVGETERYEFPDAFVIGG